MPYQSHERHVRALKICDIQAFTLASLLWSSGMPRNLPVGATFADIAEHHATRGQGWNNWGTCGQGWYRAGSWGSVHGASWGSVTGASGLGWYRARSWGSVTPRCAPFL